MASSLANSSTSSTTQSGASIARAVQPTRAAQSASTPKLHVNNHKFHPAIATWFAQRFPGGPTEAQAQSWPVIALKRDALISAPTGAGKTLAGFLMSIDNLYQRHAKGESITNASQIVYVSPLKALATDIAENLQRPLAEIAQVATAMGIEPPNLTVAVRTGDTPHQQRTAMLKRPPNFVITTPESLYLLLTSAKSRENLRTVETVIVDEIHATARDKRGSHLALSLERLEHVANKRPTRIGLSATQHPIETIANLLTGNANSCTIINTGHKRTLDVDIELIDNELEAVASQAQTEQMLDRMAMLIGQHHTTIVFVNTRRLAERLAHQLGDKLGPDVVAAHHGSLSTERRAHTEQRLRAGELKALVATASLELGIDIGPVELVCQVGSPRSIATFLQRVGRSNHTHGGIPKGRLFPLTRDELIECLALLQAVHHGQLDAVRPPVAPMDILVQQIVAEAAADNTHTTSGLYNMYTSAAPYAALTKAQFQQAITQASKGVTTGRGPRGAHLHHDTINDEVRGKRGARLAAITSGGAIGENADYRVLAEPDDTFIGTVNEDWAVESMVGDIFLLGSHSWRIKQVAAGTVRVTDAGDIAPTVPFWLGEAPARSAELSEQVSAIRTELDELLFASTPSSTQPNLASDNTASGANNHTASNPETLPQNAASNFARQHNVSQAAAEQAVAYIAAGRSALGATPTHQTIVFERFFDETGGQQLVVHSPYGGRINRAFGLALRKRFCRRFDFELQAAATDNAIVLSLGPHHSFPLSDVPQFLHPDSLEEVLEQAVLDSPMFLARWRWNLNRALVVLRNRGGKRKPPAIQRMEANDIMAAVFPQAAACQENLAGPIQIPDHLLVRQTLHDTLHEALDVAGLKKLLQNIRDGEIKAHFCDTAEPSPFSHEVINAKPYAFLDDAEIADRRTNAVATPRGLRLPQQGAFAGSGSGASAIGVDAPSVSQITADAIAQVVAEATPNPRNPDELHDVLTLLVCTTPRPEWQELYNSLASRNRVCTLSIAGTTLDGATSNSDVVWATAELGAAALSPSQNLARVRGHLDVAGPISPQQLSTTAGISVAEIHQALAVLEAEGAAMVCPNLAVSGNGVSKNSTTSCDASRHDANSCDVTEETAELWCSRRLLIRMAYLSRRQKRASVKAASVQDFMRFLLRWQHRTPETTLRGRAGLIKAIEQLQGLDLPATAWEHQILAERVEDYQPLWLDELCYRGELTWLRLKVPATTSRSNALTPRRATPISLVFREDLQWLLAAARTASTEPPDVGPISEIAGILKQHGASFMHDLAANTQRLPDDIERALWNGVALGLFTADGFAAIRALLGTRNRSRHRHKQRSGTRRSGYQPRLASKRPGHLQQGSTTNRHTHQAAPGRWSLVAHPEDLPKDDLAEALAQQMLACWGVVFHSLAYHPAHPTAVPWRDILKALRRFEDRGIVRGGRFVTGQSGEQFALPAAADELQKTQRTPRINQQITIAACDPLNLTGVIFDGPRIPATPNNTLTFLDGLPT